MNSRPDLSLTDLSETVLLIDGKAILERLAAYGCRIECPEGGWRRLSNGREYVACAGGQVRISGVPCNLSMEISRACDDPGHRWSGSIELSPADAGDSTWVDAIRKLLSETFQRVLAGAEGAAETFERGSLEQVTLFPGPPQRARLLLHRREQFRGGS